MSWKLYINKPLTFDQRQQEALRKCEERLIIDTARKEVEVTGYGVGFRAGYGNIMGDGWGFGATVGGNASLQAGDGCSAKVWEDDC